MRRLHHVLIVGGSGMLAGVARTLVAEADRVSVLARNEKRIRAIAENIVPVICDYNDGAALSEALSLIASPDLVIGWIHGRAPGARRALAECVAADGRFIQILGSAHGDPSHPERMAEMEKTVAGLPIDYQAIVLGFVREGATARWLSDEEICAGVLKAVRSEQPITIVGTVEPWSARP